MPIVQETVTDPAGNALPEVQIDIVLIGSIEADGNAPGYASSPNTILGRWRTWTDAEGQWSADLIANSALEPDNTYYTLTRKGRGAESNEALLVPSGTATYWVHEVLTVPPLTLPTFLSDAAALALASPAAAGSGGKGAREDHVHPTTGLAVLASANTFAARQDVAASVRLKGPSPWLDVTHPDYGAIVDGSNHPLSGVYATIAAARLAYPLTHAYLTANSLTALALTDQLDWVAIQEALLAVGTAGRGRVYTPGMAHPYKINRTLYIGGAHFGPGDSQGIAGLVWMGDQGQAYSSAHPGTALQWIGNATDPLILMQDTHKCDLENLAFLADVSKPLKYGVEIENLAGGTVTTGKCRFVNIQMDGTTYGIETGFYAPDQTSHPNTVNGNNDYHEFHSCAVRNYKTSFATINSSQAKNWVFVDCTYNAGADRWARGAVICGMDFAHGTAPGVLNANNPNGGTATWLNGGSFRWTRGGGGSTGALDPTSVAGDAGVGEGDGLDAFPATAAFILSATSDSVTIEDANCEADVRFIFIKGASTVGPVVRMVGNRTGHYNESGSHLPADGYHVRLEGASALDVSANRIFDGPATGHSQYIRVSAASILGATIAVLGNYCESNNNSRLVEAIGGTGQPNLIVAANINKNLSSGVTQGYPPVVAPLGRTSPLGDNNHTLDYTDVSGLNIINPITANRTFTLPDATRFKWCLYYCQRGASVASNGAGGIYKVLFATTSAQTINGIAASEFALLSPYQTLELWSDGVNWLAFAPLGSAAPLQGTNADLTLSKANMQGLVVVDTSGALRTVTIPAAADAYRGDRVTVKRSGGNNVAFAGANVDGAAASGINLAGDLQKVTIACDGAAWWTI